MDNFEKLSCFATKNEIDGRNARLIVESCLARHEIKLTDIAIELVTDDFKTWIGMLLDDEYDSKILEIVNSHRNFSSQ